MGLSAFSANVEAPLSNRRPPSCIRDHSFFFPLSTLKNFIGKSASLFFGFSPGFGVSCIVFPCAAFGFASLRRYQDNTSAYEIIPINADQTIRRIWILCTGTTKENCSAERKSLATPGRIRMKITGRIIITSADRSGEIYTRVHRIIRAYMKKIRNENISIIINSSLI
jgi:hypothetical protein